MASLQEKIEHLISAELPEGQADLATLPNGNVSGHVITRAFDELDYEDRRAVLRRLWAQRLLPEEVSKIGTLLTYTPEEWHVPLSADE